MEKTLKEIVTELRKTLRCNCDLDNWEPTQATGHSLVCRIHNIAIEEHSRQIATKNLHPQTALETTAETW